MLITKHLNFTASGPLANLCCIYIQILRPRNIIRYSAVSFLLQNNVVIIVIFIHRQNFISLLTSIQISIYLWDFYFQCTNQTFWTIVLVTTLINCCEKLVRDNSFKLYRKLYVIVEVNSFCILWKTMKINCCNFTILTYSMIVIIGKGHKNIILSIIGM